MEMPFFNVKAFFKKKGFSQNAPKNALYFSIVALS